MAGPAGIEPTLTVLETVVLPLYDGPTQETLYLIESIFQLHFSGNLNQLHQQKTAPLKPKS